MFLETRLVSNSWSFQFRLLLAETKGTCYHTGIFHPFAAVFCLFVCLLSVIVCLRVLFLVFFFCNWWDWVQFYISDVHTLYPQHFNVSVQPRRVSPTPLHWKPHPFPHTSFLKSWCHWCSKLSSQHVRHTSVTLVPAVRGQRTDVGEDSLNEALPSKQNQTQF